MSSAICARCHSALHRRLQAAITLKQSQRSKFHSHPIQHAKLRPSQQVIPSYSVYKDTIQPNSTQLRAAKWFFDTFRPHKIWTGYEWQKTSPSTSEHDAPPTTLLPEIAFLGRSNVGKSSLLNALLCAAKLNHVGAKAGKTQTIHAWGLVYNPANGKVKGLQADMSDKLALLDMPGYGYRSHVDMGKGIMKYLEDRKNLRRAFLIIDTQHGVKPDDIEMLNLLQHLSVSYQIILGKCDRLVPKPGEDAPELLEAIERIEKVLQTVQGQKGNVLNITDMLAVGQLGGKAKVAGGMRGMGIEEVQWAVLRATGLDEYAVNKFAVTTTVKDVEHTDPSVRHDGGSRLMDMVSAAKKQSQSLPPSPSNWQPLQHQTAS